MAWPFSCLMILYFALVILQSPHNVAQNNGRVAVGQTLSANKNGSSWLSPAGDFAFGFHQVVNTNNLFLLSIWYVKIPDTIVWYANEGEPVPQGSTLRITVSDGLVLSDPQGTQLWSTTTELSGGRVVSLGYMNDTGNFLLQSSNDNEAIWQSFGHPTDTLLPNQILEAGFKVDCRLSETNFTKGRFQLRLFRDGNLVLNTRDLVSDYAYSAYYVSGTGPKNPGEKLIYSESGDMYISMKNGSRFDLIPSDKVVAAKTYYQRVTLNSDGVLTWNYHSRTLTGNSSTGWSTSQSLPDNICMQTAANGGDVDSGACGYNSICSNGDDNRPICTCPPSYSLLDANDTRGSCAPDFRLDVCDKREQGVVKGKYKLVSLQKTDWTFSDYARLYPCSEEDCKISCLNDCFCAAAIFDSSSSSCWKKKLPLSNGRQDSGVNRTAWLKLGNGNDSIEPINPFIPSIEVKYRRNRITTALLSSSVCVIFILLAAIGLGIFFVYKRKRFQGFVELHNSTLREYNTVHRFSYKELEHATNGFQEEIGSGAFGQVYKGRIGSGDHPILVAVKKLERMSNSADKEFTAEVNAIGQIHHKNLVRFVGFCKEGEQRLLVYEYMSNGTVADCLFGTLRPSWNKRMHIAQGIAEGLLYLHEECNTQIIHCDIKPQNVLLDDYHNARISDFGLAKLLGINQHQTNTGIRGTKDYLAPEWFRNKPITTKVDVYSFGVMLLEIISCRRSICMEISPEERAILTDWACDCYQNGALDSLVIDDIEALNDRPQLERLVKVALWCIQEDPNIRPTMKRVRQMLEGIAQVSDPPCPTSFSITTEA